MTKKVYQGKSAVSEPETNKVDTPLTPTGALVYDAVNMPVLECVPVEAKRILDLGCGSGTMGGWLKQRRECEIVGVTYSSKEAQQAEAVLDKVLVCDLNAFDASGLDQFDCILASHVLEHLYQPEALLARLHGALAPGGTLLVALPNILHWRPRLAFARGRFRYTDGGVMDSTHFRFFDWETAHALVENAGYTVTGRMTQGAFPLPGLRRVFGGVAASLDALSTKVAPGLFGYQFILSAKP